MNVARHEGYLAHAYRVKEAHQPYLELYSRLKKTHQKTFSDLSLLASESLRVCANTFDTFDVHRESRPLRHLIHESSEMVFYAFNGQLGFQTGANIAWRFGRIAYIEDDLPEDPAEYALSDFRQRARSAYMQDRNDYQESRLISDESFRSLVRDLKRRTDAKRGGELLMTVQEQMTELRAAWREARGRFREGREEIEEAFEKNALEAFPLSSSPLIRRALSKMSAQFDSLDHLQALEVERDSAHKYQNYISVCIYNCALLHAVCGLHSWGWD